MNPLYKVSQYFASTDSKVDRVRQLEQELFELNAEKALLLDNYQVIMKAMNCEDFVCKKEVKFDQKAHITSLATMKFREKKVNEEIAFLKSFKSVSKEIQEEETEKAKIIIKSLYRSGKIGLDSYSKTFKNKTDEGQTQYADIIVIDHTGKLLMTKRSQWEDDHKGAWVIPGGHVDPGEEVENAGKRELKEETGIDVDRLMNDPKATHPVWFSAGTFKDKNVHITYFLLTGVDPKDFEILLDEAETRDYKWVPKEEINNYPMIFNMADNVRKILQWDNYPQVEIIKKAVRAGLFKPEDVIRITTKLKNQEAE